MDAPDHFDYQDDPVTLDRLKLGKVQVEVYSKSANQRSRKWMLRDCSDVDTSKLATCVDGLLQQYILGEVLPTA